MTHSQKDDRMSHRLPYTSLFFITFQPQQILKMPSTAKPTRSMDSTNYIQKIQAAKDRLAETRDETMDDISDDSPDESSHKPSEDLQVLINFQEKILMTLSMNKSKPSS